MRASVSSFTTGGCRRLLSSPICTFSTAASSSPTPKPFDSIPGPPLIPQAGTAYDFISRLTKHQGSHQKLEFDYYKEYGRISRHHVGEPTVWLFHPDDMLEAFRQEGPYPTNGASEVWPVTEWQKTKNRPFLNQVGPEWVRLRSAVQKDMFAPAVAESYLPLLDEPTRLASKQIPLWSDALDKFTPFVATDLFFSIILGYNPITVTSRDPILSKKIDPEDLEFVTHAMNAMEGFIALLRQPHLRRTFKTDPQWLKLADTLEKVHARSAFYLRRAVEDKESANQDPLPYIHRLMGRKELDMDETINVFSDFLFAGVDTTHHVLLWLIYNLAKYPEKQALLYQELSQAVQDKNAPLTTQHIRLPYLSAFYRESHRLTPAISFLSMRRFDRPITVNGYQIPQNVPVNCFTHVIQNQEEIVDNPQEFLPERWLPEAVKQRKGTPKELLDHKLLNNPFGFGPRMCLGARVALTEIRTFISRLVLDWEIRFESKNPNLIICNKSMMKPAPFPKVQFIARK